MLTAWLPWYLSTKICELHKTLQGFNTVGTGAGRFADFFARQSGYLSNVVTQRLGAKNFLS